MASVKLLLGSNLGNRRELILDAISRISESVGRIIKQTSLTETEPWGYESENSYLNAVVEVQTALTPLEVLDTVLHIEWLMGRRRTEGAIGYEDRPIDIDLLYYHADGDNSQRGLEFHNERLTLPHPRIEERDFVLALLLELRNIGN